MAIAYHNVIVSSSTTSSYEHTATQNEWIAAWSNKVSPDDNHLLTMRDKNGTGRIAFYLTNAGRAMVPVPKGASVKVTGDSSYASLFMIFGCL